VNNMARWIKCKTRMPKPPKGQDFAPVLFFVPRLGNNGVCAGRYFQISTVRNLRACSARSSPQPE